MQVGMKSRMSIRLLMCMLKTIPAIEIVANVINASKCMLKFLHVHIFNAIFTTCFNFFWFE